jgi:hypothetical protein
MLTEVSYMLDKCYEKTVSSKLYRSCKIFIRRKQKPQDNVINVKLLELERC